MSSIDPAGMDSDVFDEWGCAPMRNAADVPAARGAAELEWDDPDLFDHPLAQEIGGQPLNKGAFFKLRELGVPMDFAGELHVTREMGAAMVSIGKARPGRALLYEPVGPDARLILMVREYGVPVDLVALASHDPDQWALRRGAGWCLGHDRWVAAQQAALAERITELRVFSTPIDWLRGRGAGICVLHWDTAALGQLRQLGERVVLRVDAGAGERLRQLLAHGGLPRVKESAPAPMRRAA